MAGNFVKNNSINSNNLVSCNQFVASDRNYGNESNHGRYERETQMQKTSNLVQFHGDAHSSSTLFNINGNYNVPGSFIERRFQENRVENSIPGDHFPPVRTLPFPDRVSRHLEDRRSHYNEQSIMQRNSTDAIPNLTDNLHVNRRQILNNHPGHLNLLENVEDRVSNFQYFHNFNTNVSQLEPHINGIPRRGGSAVNILPQLQPQINDVPRRGGSGANVPQIRQNFNEVHQPQFRNNLPVPNLIQDKIPQNFNEVPPVQIFNRPSNFHDLTFKPNLRVQERDFEFNNENQINQVFQKQSPGFNHDLVNCQANQIPKWTENSSHSGNHNLILKHIEAPPNCEINQTVVGQNSFEGVYERSINNLKHEPENLDETLNSNQPYRERVLPFAKNSNRHIVTNSKRRAKIFNNHNCGNDDDQTTARNANESFMSISSEDKEKNVQFVKSPSPLTKIKERCKSLSPERILKQFRNEKPDAWSYQPEERGVTFPDNETLNMSQNICCVNGSVPIKVEDDLERRSIKSETMSISRQSRSDSTSSLYSQESNVLEPSRNLNNLSTFSTLSGNENLTSSVYNSSGIDPSVGLENSNTHVRAFSSSSANSRQNYNVTNDINRSDAVVRQCYSADFQNVSNLEMCDISNPHFQMVPLVTQNRLNKTEIFGGQGSNLSMSVPQVTPAVLNGPNGFPVPLLDLIVARPPNLQNNVEHLVPVGVPSGSSKIFSHSPQILEHQDRLRFGNPELKTQRDSETPASGYSTSLEHEMARSSENDMSIRSSSPERKYLHLIRMRSLSKSPERKFLERIKTKTEKRRSRSRSPRSLSPESKRYYEWRYRHSKKQSYSRSPSYHRSKSPSHRRRKSYSRSPSRRRSRSASPHKYSSSKSQSSVRSPGKRVSSPDRCKRSSDSYKTKYNSHDDNKHLKDGKDDKQTERESLLRKYCKDYCSDVNEMNNKLSKINIEELVKKEAEIWTRMSPANLFYTPTGIENVLQGTAKLERLCNEFENVLVKRAEKVRAEQPKYEIPARKKKMKFSKHKSKTCSGSSSCNSSDSESGTSSDEDCTMEELERKRKHPFRLHQELWFNDLGEMNDGPLCRCSAKARRSGIRHNIYAGELNLPKCNVYSNNANVLHHYRVTISPPTNFLIKTPTIIPYDDHEFIFEGFSMFSHIRLDKLPVCKVIRFNIEYTILYFEERMPENFTIKELDLFYDYLFKELLELVDLDFKAGGDQSRCAQFHFMPRFVRELPDRGKEILSMNEVLTYLLKNSDDLINKDDLIKIQKMSQYEWQKQVDLVKGMVVTVPGMKPCSLRVDQLDRDLIDGKTSLFPEIVHFGIRPPQLSYAGNPEYQKAWREYVKFRHLLANMPKPSFEDKRKLEIKENKLQEMRTQSKMKRDVTVTVNSEDFKKTGIMCDIVQHAMLIPVLVSHLRFHCSLGVLEDTISYKFKNRFLLQLALTHPSYRENFGTNPDHARNSLTNCGIRQPEYGDRRIHYMNTRKRGINTLINIMSRFGKKMETESNITHNERLEFLGDAVVEFITSIHLFHMFPDLEEGGLATYRAAIVQNQHLAVLAKTLKLDEFMLYAHGSDLCHDLELRHAMANCFEALMGALFLDGGIKIADKVFGETLFKSEADMLEVWVNYPPHPLQEQEPLGDRKWIPRFELLKKLTNFEESIGVEFTHIRLLARAFTDRSIGYTNLTLGSNQRLEFLGDTVLQLIASEYLYKYFPEHHEGHLSLLRSSLVNNRTQAVVCNDLDMTKYALYHNPKGELKTKDRADLLEAFLGALYVDKGLEFCQVFCNVCFFPRLQTFIMHQDWNDPKSKLQQCCLTLRTMEGGEPEIPIYKVIECMGPTNTRIYTVAVYFKGERLAEASGLSIQQAEMNAAKKALQRSQGLFPQLDHQKRVIAKSLKSQHTRPDFNRSNLNAAASKKYSFNKTVFRKDKFAKKSDKDCDKIRNFRKCL